ncbi:MAG: FtsQ-type POTRA domain-containing protein [Anaerolineales bacterium]|nr:FtsQ-type POTRA domain-containing protein [Anaerolineales bacterium]
MALDSRALHSEAGTRTTHQRGVHGDLYPRPTIGARRRSQPRRRLVLPVSRVDGAEMQLPALPAFRQARRFVALILMAGVFLLGFNLINNPRYMVGMPVISGERILSDVQVSSIASVRGKSIFLVDPQAVQDRLESYPEIGSARVSLKWPATVEIEIQERVPVIRWTDGGRVWWISKEGIAFLGRESETTLPNLVSYESVLQITEDPLEPVIDPAVVLAVQNLTSAMPEVQLFTFDREHGLGFTDPHGWQAYFGQGGNLSQKMVVYQAVVSQLLEKEYVPELVSVEQITAPYYQ